MAAQQYETKARKFRRGYRENPGLRKNLICRIPLVPGPETAWLTGTAVSGQISRMTGKMRG